MVLNFTQVSFPKPSMDVYYGNDLYSALCRTNALFTSEVCTDDRNPKCNEIIQGLTLCVYIMCQALFQMFFCYLNFVIQNKYYHHHSQI